MEYKRLNGVFERYEVSKTGIVRNVYTGKIIKGTIGKDKNNEYVHIRVKKNGKSHHKRLHQLVMEAWGEPKPSGNYVIDHIDRNKLNNNITNLRWVSRKENVENSDYYDSGLRSKKIEPYKFPKKKVIVNNILFDSHWEASKYIKENTNAIQSVKNITDRMYSKRENIFGYEIKYL